MNLAQRRGFPAFKYRYNTYLQIPVPIGKRCNCRAAHNIQRQPASLKMKYSSKHQKTLGFASIIVLLIALTVLGPWVNNSLSWDRHGLENLQYWRLITGHFVHTNFWHGCMNAIALAMALYIFGNSFSLKHWLLAPLILCLTISLCLLIFEAWLSNYVGFSGVLYGVFAMCLIYTFRQKPLLNSFLFFGLSWKVISQQMPHFDTDYLRSTIGAAVIVEAHLYGYLGGIILGVSMLFADKHSGKA